MTQETTQAPDTASDQNNPKETPKAQAVTQPKGEIGGTKGQEPTIFGDWQHAGRCSDF